MGKCLVNKLLNIFNYNIIYNLCILLVYITYTSYSNCLNVIRTKLFNAYLST